MILLNEGNFDEEYWRKGTDHGKYSLSHLRNRLPCLQNSLLRLFSRILYVHLQRALEASHT